MVCFSSDVLRAVQAQIEPAIKYTANAGSSISTEFEGLAINTNIKPLRKITPKKAKAKALLPSLLAFSPKYISSRICGKNKNNICIISPRCLCENRP